MHVPEATKLATVQLTVQTDVVSEEKLTASPDVAVADNVSGVPTFCLPGWRT